MMESCVGRFVVLVSLIHSIQAQFPFAGACPEMAVQQNFDMGQFKGTWYEMARTISFLETGAVCVSVSFKDTIYNDSSIEVLNEGRGPILGLHKKVRLIATVPDLAEPAKMQMRLNDLRIYGDYWVLKTDYTQYAVVWSCNPVWLTRKHFHTENLWILSRQRTMSPEIREDIDEFLKSKSIKSRKFLLPVKQRSCE